MNGIEKITERISADAQSEIDAINAETQSKCQEIAVKYDKLQKEEYWKVIDKGTKAAEIRAERLENLAAMEMKRQLLFLKQEMVSKAFDTALNKLTQLPEAEYVALLAKFAQKGSRTGTEHLIFSPQDRMRYGKAVCVAANELLAGNGKTANLTMSEGSRDIRGGLIISDGNVDVNYSFEALILLHKDKLMEKVSKILFD